MFKYYAYNLVASGKLCGSRVIKVWFFQSPIKVIEYAVLDCPYGMYIVDLKRLK
jgi:hypothetical protein